MEFDKPNSVPSVRAVIIYLTGPLPVRLSDLPWSIPYRNGTGNSASLTGISPNLILHQAGFVVPSHATMYPFKRIFKIERCGDLLHHHFTLIPIVRDGILSVTLSISEIKSELLIFSRYLPSDVWTFLPFKGDYLNSIGSILINF